MSGKSIDFDDEKINKSNFDRKKNYLRQMTLMLIKY